MVKGWWDSCAHVAYCRIVEMGDPILAPKATAVVTIAHEVIEPASLRVRHSTVPSATEP